MTDGDLHSRVETAGAGEAESEDPDIVRPAFGTTERRTVEARPEALETEEVERRTIIFASRVVSQVELYSCGEPRVKYYSKRGKQLIYRAVWRGSYKRASWCLWCTAGGWWVCGRGILDFRRRCRNTQPILNYTSIHHKIESHQWCIGYVDSAVAAQREAR